jgi:4'-phosphopantetheinyl transferase
VDTVARRAFGATVKAGGVEVHLGAVVPELTAELAANVLSPSERQRVDRLRLPAEASRYVAGRAFLRQVLSRYLGVAPAAVPLAAYAPGVKPELEDGARLPFSLSRAGNHLVVAVSLGDGGIGVDAEAWSGPRAARALGELPVAAALTAAEAEALAALPPAARARRFVGVWARKEAVAKATGQGIALLPPAAFAVGMEALATETRSHPTGAIARVSGPVGVAGVWSLHAVELEALGITVAVAIAARGPVPVAWSAR